MSTRKASWEYLALLRFFLAWVVMSGHLTWYTIATGWPQLFDMFGGKAAVVGFLLVSGYSIAASLSREAEGFYRRRFLRVYPLYFFAILSTIALEAWTHGHVQIPTRSIDSLGWKTAVGNLFFLQTFAVKPIAFDGPVWSLAIEVFYYVLAPLFARLDKSKLLALISISFVCYLLPKRTNWGIVYLGLSKFNALNYLWCWLLGFLIWRDSSLMVRLVALAGIPAMLWGPATPEPLSLATYLLALCLIVSADRIQLPKQFKAFADYLGDISYPLYVIHFPTIILGYAILGINSPLALAILAILVTIAAFHFVDGFLKRRYLVPYFRRRSKSDPNAAIASVPST